MDDIHDVGRDQPGDDIHQYRRGFIFSIEIEFRLNMDVLNEEMTNHLEEGMYKRGRIDGIKMRNLTNLLTNRHNDLHEPTRR